MGKLVVGSLASGVVMFVLGFVFYGILLSCGWKSAPEATQLAIQQALKALPGTGHYIIPMGETPSMMAAYQAGPVTQIAYNASGFPMADPKVFAGGFVHMVVSNFLIGLLLFNLRDRVVGFAERAKIVVAVAAIFVVYIHFAEPIWYHGDWRNALYVSVADTVMFVIGGLIIARWFLPRAVDAPATLAG